MGTQTLIRDKCAPSLVKCFHNTCMTGAILQFVVLVIAKLCLIIFTPLSDMVISYEYSIKEK